MSKSLYWRPVPQEPKRYSIGCLKYIIIEYYGEESDLYDYTKVGKELIPFLKGVKASSSDQEVVAGALALIEAIEKHGEVEIFLY